MKSDMAEARRHVESKYAVISDQIRLMVGQRSTFEIGKVRVISGRISILELEGESK